MKRVNGKGWGCYHERELAALWFPGSPAIGANGGRISDEVPLKRNCALSVVCTTLVARGSTRKISKTPFPATSDV